MQIVKVNTGPGKTVAAVTPSVVVMVNSPEDGLITRLWECLGAGGMFGDVVAELGFGRLPIEKVPNFALAVVEEGSLHVGLRGPFRACDQQGRVLGTGAGASTWNEAFIDNLQHLLIDDSTEHSGACEFPIVSGITLVSCVSLTLDAGAVSTTDEVSESGDFGVSGGADEGGRVRLADEVRSGVAGAGSDSGGSGIKSGTGDMNSDTGEAAINEIGVNGQSVESVVRVEDGGDTNTGDSYVAKEVDVSGEDIESVPRGENDLDAEAVAGDIPAGNTAEDAMNVSHLGGASAPLTDSVSHEGNIGSVPPVSSITGEYEILATGEHATLQQSAPQRTPEQTNVHTEQSSVEKKEEITVRTELSSDNESLHTANLEETRLPLEEPELASIVQESFFIDSVPGNFGSGVASAVENVSVGREEKRMGAAPSVRSFSETETSFSSQGLSSPVITNVPHTGTDGRNSGLGNGVASETTQLLGQAGSVTAISSHGVDAIDNDAAGESVDAASQPSAIVKQKDSLSTFPSDAGFIAVQQEGEGGQAESESGEDNEASDHIALGNEFRGEPQVDPMGTGELSLADLRRGLSIQAPPRSLSLPSPHVNEENVSQASGNSEKMTSAGIFAEDKKTGEGMEGQLSSARMQAASEPVAEREQTGGQENHQVFSSSRNDNASTSSSDHAAWEPAGSPPKNTKFTEAADEENKPSSPSFEVTSGKPGKAPALPAVSSPEAVSADSSSFAAPGSFSSEGELTPHESESKSRATAEYLVPSELPSVDSTAYEPSDSSASGSFDGLYSQDMDDEGETVIASRAAELREQIADVASQAFVWGLMCPAGHVNPATIHLCGLCGAPLGGQATWYPRPILGEVWVSTGLNIPLDADIVVGRKPSSTAQMDRPRAHLVPVPSPEQQISRTHCEIRIENWDVLLIDRDSNNGTFVLRSGGSPIQVHPSQPFPLQVGDVIAIGEGVTLHMRGPGRLQ